MKKISLILMTLILMVFSILGATAEGTVPTAEPEHVLIAYYSRTGNTEEIALKVQELVGGDLAKIETAEPYPEDYTATTEVAEAKLEANARPAITTVIENIEQYDTIYLGYPIWYHFAPMAVNTFIEAYDLTGKTIVPFCTSGSTPIDESLASFREMYPDYTFLDGLTANSPDDVEPWLTKLSEGE